jgi:hypothetical protein
MEVDHIILYENEYSEMEIFGLLYIIFLLVVLVLHHE